jgi:hypothetical protein
MVSYLSAGTKTEADKINIFAELLEKRGRASADYWMVLARVYKKKRIINVSELTADCMSVLKYEPVGRTTLPVYSFLVATAAIFVLLVVLIMLSIGGHTIQQGDRGLLGMVMALLAGISVYSGTGTASVKAALPTSKGKQIAIRLTGTAGAVVGTAILFHWIGY